MPSKDRKQASSPTDGDIETALRKVVFAARKEDTVQDLTVNKARGHAEQALGLEDGYLKSHSTWKTRSREVVQAALDEPSPTEPDTPSKSVIQPGPGKKRANGDATDRPEKRRKSVTSDEARSNDSSALSEPDLSDNEDAVDKRSTKRAHDHADGDSDLSDVIDEPAPKKKRAGSGASKPPAAKKAKPKVGGGKAAKEADLSPDEIEIEIKRLQGWLVKCGVRKLWHRELAPYDSNKAKIKHLKQMLEDVGLTGRYSVEKASAIKEQRELAADLEAVKEGNKTWGKNSESDATSDRESAMPAKRRPAASRFIDFGSDDEDD